MTWLRVIQLFACCLLALQPIAEAVVVGGAILPHGDIALAPDIIHNANGSLFLHEQCVAAGEYIAGLKPDIVLLTTPHGIALSKSYTVYLNSEAAGNLLVGDLDLKERFKMNTTLGMALAKHLQNSREYDFATIDQLLSFSGATPQELKWGELIPLAFIPEKTMSKSQLIVVSQPWGNHPLSPQKIEDAVTLGSNLFDYFENLPERVVFVSSADLAHTHLASGPYGYSPLAEPFDRLCGMWAEAPETRANDLIYEASLIEEEASSCGFFSLLITHGILRERYSRWQPRKLCNVHPTYFGMLVATY